MKGYDMSKILYQVKNEIKQQNGKGLNAKIQTEISQNIEKPEYQEKMQKMNFKFFSSADCGGHKEYQPTGAQFTFQGEGNFMCNPDEITFQPARAIASIENGKIKSIHLLNKGKGYPQAPQIKIIGGGNAKAKAIIDGEGRIQMIDVINSGKSVQNTPQIQIQKPNLSRSCHLCVKK